MSFGNNLQYLRQLSGNMTQEVLAEKLNVSRQTISKWEMDAANPEMDALDRVFKYAKENGIENLRVIGWGFPNLSVEQINVFNMHGYTAARILPEGVTPEGLVYEENGVIPCFETDGESMDVYIAIK